MLAPCLDISITIAPEPARPKADRCIVRLRLGSCGAQGFSVEACCGAAQISGCEFDTGLNPLRRVWQVADRQAASARTNDPAARNPSTGSVVLNSSSRGGLSRMTQSACKKRRRGRQRGTSIRAPTANPDLRMAGTACLLPTARASSRVVGVPRQPPRKIACRRTFWGRGRQEENSSASPIAIPADRRLELRRRYQGKDLISSRVYAKR